MANGTTSPIVIKRIRKAGHGHHGGAWKVAYADFVTAMMALFMVLWLMASDEQTKKAVGGYFSDPTGAGKQQGTTKAGVGEGIAVSKDDLKDLKSKLEQAMKQLPKFDQLKNNVQLTMTHEGLRIELLESEKGTFFESGSPQPTPLAADILDLLTDQLKQMKNPLLIEGHTDAKPYPGNDYTNWELSTDRANSARRLMIRHGLPPQQVQQVRGFADQQLRDKTQPENPANRRVSVLVGYGDSPPPKPAAAPPPQPHPPR